MSTLTVPKMKIHVVRPTDDDTGRISALTLAPNGRIFAAAACDVLASDDDGKTFHRVASLPSSAAIYGIHAEAERVWVVGGGDDRAIRVSDDGGMTWTNLSIEHQGNLYRMQRAPDGALWACGDREALLRSTDGLRFDVPEERKGRERGGQRYLDVIFEDGAMLLLGSSGGIDRVRGKVEERLALEAKKPITRRLVVGQTWLVFGDSGTAYRSADGGKTFSRIDLPVNDDLEDAVATDRGVFVVGGSGALLFSKDDGKTFAKIPTELDGHLWSVLEARDGRLLVAGDDGLVAAIEISASETMTVPALETANAVEEEDEEEDEEEEEEEPAESTRKDRGAPLSRAAASARWKTEGRAFISALNAYVRACYDVGPNKAGKEPSETREDMAEFVRMELVLLNSEGKHEEARELYPPAYEPFDYEALGTSIDALAFLDEKRRVVAVRGAVFVLERGRITEVPDLTFFGRSSDKKLWAKVHADRIDVHRDWDGPKVGSIPYSGPTPEQVVLTPEGDAAAIAGGGVFWVHASGTVRELQGDASYCHVALSPNGRFLAYGTQDTAHVLLDRKTGREHRFDPMSSYPHFAFFHHDEPKVVFSSCHALYGSASMLVDVDRLAAGKPKHAQPLDRRAWVHSGASWGDRFLLGDRSGYVWAKKPGDDESTWYLFVGSTLTALDVSQDGKKLLIGSYAGYVIELDLGPPGQAPDETLLTNGPVKETARWVFWQGHAPMIW